MKKLLKIATVVLVGLSIVGCEGQDATTLDENEAVIEETVKVEEIQEDVIEESIEESEEVEETVEEPVDEFDYDELHYYLTTNLSDEEYAKYFDDIVIDPTTHSLREIVFDAHIMAVTPSEKYKTRCELLMASGDFNDGTFTGPYIKTRDISYQELEGTREGSNVRVTATIEEYDIERGYLKIDIRKIVSR